MPQSTFVLLWKHIHLFMTTLYRLLMATFIRIVHHVAELQSSQIVFFFNSLYFSGLHIPQSNRGLVEGGTTTVWRCQYGQYGSKIISLISLAMKASCVISSSWRAVTFRATWHGNCASSLTVYIVSDYNMLVALSVNAPEEEFLCKMD